jgi:hypothetical protein
MRPTICPNCGASGTIMQVVILTAYATIEGISENGNVCWTGESTPAVDPLTFIRVRARNRN